MTEQMRPCIVCDKIPTAKNHKRFIEGSGYFLENFDSITVWFCSKGCERYWDEFQCIGENQSKLQLLKENEKFGWNEYYQFKE